MKQRNIVIITYIILGIIFLIVNNAYATGMQPADSRSEEIIKQLEKTSAWTQFKEKYGGKWSAAWNVVTGTPSLISGSSYDIKTTLNDDNVETIARNFIESNKELLKAENANLRMLDKIKVGSRYKLIFIQTINGVPIEGGTVTFSAYSNGKIISFGSNYQQGLSLTTTPSITEEEAKTSVIDHGKFDAGSYAFVKKPKLIIINDKEASEGFQLAWRVIIAADARGSWVYYISASNGSVLKHYESSERSNITGNVQGAIRPSIPSDAAEQRPFERNEVTATCGGVSRSATTGADGNYIITGISPGQCTVRIDMKGSHTQAGRSGPSDIPSCTQTFNAAQNTNYEADFNWQGCTGGFANLPEAENLYYHVTRMYNWISASPFNLNMPFMPAYYDPNFNSCQAQYEPSNQLLRFSAPNVGECLSYAFDASIIYHEYAHAIEYFIYGDDIELYLPYSTYTGTVLVKEGIADYLSATFRNNPMHSEGALKGTSKESQIRSVANDCRMYENFYTCWGPYPGNKNRWNYSIHHMGQIISGIFWDLKLNTGDNIADVLLIKGLQLKPSMPNFLDELLANIIEIDDDPASNWGGDGNPENGTPHIEEIVKAFSKHGVLYTTSPSSVRVEKDSEGQPVITWGSSKDAIITKGRFVDGNEYGTDFQGTDAYVIGYNIYRSSSQNGPFEIINKNPILGANVTSYVDNSENSITPPNQQGTYYYIVKAFDNRCSTFPCNWESPASAASPYSGNSQTYFVTLTPGWNFVGISLIQTGTTIGSLFSNPAITSIRRCDYYNPKRSCSAECYEADRDERAVAGAAYWVFNSSTEDISVSASGEWPEMPYLLPLKIGWNQLSNPTGSRLYLNDVKVYWFPNLAIAEALAALAGYFSNYSIAALNTIINIATLNGWYYSGSDPYIHYTTNGHGHVDYFKRFSEYISLAEAFKRGYFGSPDGKWRDIYKWEQGKYIPVKTHQIGNDIPAYLDPGEAFWLYIDPEKADPAYFYYCSDNILVAALEIPEYPSSNSGARLNTVDMALKITGQSRDGRVTAAHLVVGSGGINDNTVDDLADGDALFRRYDLDLVSSRWELKESQLPLPETGVTDFKMYFDNERHGGHVIQGGTGSQSLMITGEPDTDIILRWRPENIPINILATAVSDSDLCTGINMRDKDNCVCHTDENGICGVSIIIQRLTASVTFTPTDGAFTNNRQQTITINYSAAVSINTANTRLFINGNEVAFNLIVRSGTRGTITYTPSAPLSEGQVDVRLRLVPNTGGGSDFTSKFFVDSTPVDIFDLNPVNGDTASFRPYLAARIVDNSSSTASGVDPNSISARVVRLADNFLIRNFTPAQMIYVPMTGRFEIRADDVPSLFPFGGFDNFRFIVTARDYAGNSKTVQTDFVVLFKNWQTYQGDSNLSGYAPVQITPPLTMLWSKSINYMGEDRKDSAPIVWNDYVFVQSEYLYALDIDTGRVHWVNGKNADGTFDKIDGHCTPVIFNTRLYAFSESNKTLYILDAFTGEIQQKTQIPDGRCLWSGLTMNSTDNILYMNDMGNSLLRFIDANTGALMTSVPSGGGLANPAYSQANNMVIVAGDKLYAYNAQTGAQLWVYGTGNPSFTVCSAIFGDNTIYFGSNSNKIYAVNTNGQDIAGWPVTITGVGWPGFRDPAILRDASSNIQNIIFPATEGKIIAMNPNGSIAWNKELHYLIIAPPLVTSDHIFFILNDGNLYSYDHSGNFEWVTSFNNYDGYVMGNRYAPAVTNDKIFITSGLGEIYSFVSGARFSEGWNYVSAPVEGASDASAQNVFFDDVPAGQLARSGTILILPTWQTVDPADTILTGSGYAALFDTPTVLDGPGNFLDGFLSDGTAADTTMSFNTGWNMLVNPFSYNITLNDIRVFGQTKCKSPTGCNLLNAFNNELIMRIMLSSRNHVGYSYSPFTDSTKKQQLEPYRAYRFMAKSNLTFKLTANPSKVQLPFGILDDYWANFDPSADWELQFAFSAGGYKDMGLMIGQNPSASDTVDFYDMPSDAFLPKRFVKGYILSNLDNTEPQKYMMDIRNLNGFPNATNTWELYMATDYANSNGVIEWSSLENSDLSTVFKNYELLLVDCGNTEGTECPDETTVNMREQTSYHFDTGPLPDGSTYCTRHLRVRLEDLTPPEITNLHVSQIAPAGQVGPTEIKYDISENATATVKIFGPGVNSSDLIAEIGPFEADASTTATQVFSWDGLASSSVPVSPGAYRIDITAIDRVGNESRYNSLVVNVLGNWTPPDISNVDVSPEIFSPNAEGADLAISFNLSDAAASTTVAIYDTLSGSSTPVKILIEDQNRSAGSNVLHWDGILSGGTKIGTGDYAVVIKAGDAYGHNGTAKSLGFFVDAEGPAITPVLPYSASGTIEISEHYPRITATIEDVGRAGIDWESVKMFIQGIPLSFEVAEETGSISALPSFFLDYDTTYDVLVTATDTAGNEAMSSWQFKVVSQPPQITDVTITPEAILKGQMSASIGYSLSKACTISVKIYADGSVGVNPIIILLDSETQSAGNHSVSWDGEDTNGNMQNEGPYVYEISCIDMEENSAQPVLGNIVIFTDTTPPVAIAGDNFSINEGETALFDGSLSYDAEPGSGIAPDGFYWDLDEDGIYEFPGITASKYYIDDGIHNIHLKVTDSEGNAGVGVVSVSVLNVAPRPYAGVDTSVQYSDTVNFSGMFTDPGTLDTHSFTWEFGDSSSPAYSQSISHSYLVQPGQYTAIFKVTDDDGGIGTSTMTVTVEKEDSAVAYTGPVTAGYGQSLALRAEVSELDSEVGDLGGKTVTWTVGSQNASAVTDSSGVAETTLILNQPLGTYNLQTVFGGDVFYIGSEDNDQLSIQKGAATVTYTGDLNGQYSDSVSLSATLKQNGGIGIGGRTIIWVIGNQTASGVTDSTGTASASLILDQKPGDFTVVTSFDGDDYYLPAETTADFTIEKEDAELTYTGDTSEQYSDITDVKAVLKDADGVLVPGDADVGVDGRPVSFLITSDGTTGDAGSVTTSTDGTANTTIQVTRKPLQTATVETDFAGDDYYLPVHVSTVFEVPKENVVMTISNTAGDYWMVSDGTHGDERSLGMYLADEDSSKITPLGKDAPLPLELAYSPVYLGASPIPMTPAQVVTGAEDVRFRLPFESPGVFTATLSFGGNDYYNVVSAIATLTIQDSTGPNAAIAAPALSNCGLCRLVNGDVMILGVANDIHADSEMLPLNPPTPDNFESYSVGYAPGNNAVDKIGAAGALEIDSKTFVLTSGSVSPGGRIMFGKGSEVTRDLKIDTLVYEVTSISGQVVGLKPDIQYSTVAAVGKTPDVYIDSGIYSSIVDGVTEEKEGESLATWDADILPEGNYTVRLTVGEKMKADGTVKPNESTALARLTVVKPVSDLIPVSTFEIPIKPKLHPSFNATPNYLAAGSDGSIYLSTSDSMLGAIWSGSVFKVGSDGTLATLCIDSNLFEDIKSLFGKGSSICKVDKPEGVAVDGGGNVYIADSQQNVILKVAPDGSVLKAYGKVKKIKDGKVDGVPGHEPGRFDHPVGITLDAEGNLYVADTGNNRVQKIAPDGTPMLVIENLEDPLSGGAIPNNMPPLDLCRLHIEKIRDFLMGGHHLCSEAENAQARSLFGEGMMLFAIGKLPEALDKFRESHAIIEACRDAALAKRLRRPADVAVDSAGNIYVADSENDRVVKFDAAGKFVAIFGERGNGRGQLDKPEGVRVGASDYVYISDKNNGRIQKFDPFGNPVLELGRMGKNKREMRRPTGIVLVGCDTKLYVADSGNRRVEIFGADNFPAVLQEVVSSEGSYPEPVETERGTTIFFRAAGQVAVEAKIMSPVGQSLRTFTEFERIGDDYSVFWDGKAADGTRAAPGRYIVEITAGAAVKRFEINVIR